MPQRTLKRRSPNPYNYVFNYFPSTHNSFHLANPKTSNFLRHLLKNTIKQNLQFEHIPCFGKTLKKRKGLQWSLLPTSFYHRHSMELIKSQGYLCQKLVIGGPPKWEWIENDLTMPQRTLKRRSPNPYNTKLKQTVIKNTCEY